MVAIAAFIAIPAAKDSSDSYTRAADDLCVQSKAQIEAVERQIPLSAGPGTFAEALVPIIAGWRYKLNPLPTPNNHAHKAAQLDLALRGVEIEAGTLARASQTGASDLLAIARQGDQASAKVEDAIKDLDLSDCQHARGWPGPGAAQSSLRSFGPVRLHGSARCDQIRTTEFP